MTRHCNASCAPPMTSQIGTHFHTRNTRNPTLGAGCRFECEPRIDILKQYSLFKHFLYQNSRTTACSDTTIETIMRDSTSVFGVQLKNTNLTPILVRKNSKPLYCQSQHPLTSALLTSKTRAPKSHPSAQPCLTASKGRQADN